MFGRCNFILIFQLFVYNFQLIVYNFQNKFTLPNGKLLQEKDNHNRAIETVAIRTDTQTTSDKSTIVSNSLCDPTILPDDGDTATQEYQ